MSESLHTFGEWLGWWSVLTFAISLPTAMVYPLFRRFVANSCPAFRAAVTLAFGIAGPAAAAFALILVLQPHLSALVIPAHCHGGICGAHPPQFDASTLGGAALTAGGSLLLGSLLISLAVGLRAVRNRLGTLRAFSRPGRTVPYRVVDSPRPLAWCFGLWRQEIFLTSGLVDALPPTQLRAVVLHEQAHARRRDNLRATVLGLSTIIWPRRLRTSIRSDLATDSELACDAAVVSETGDAGALRSAIRKLHGNAGVRPEGAGSAFGELAASVRLAAQHGRRDAPAKRLFGLSLLGLVWFLQVMLGTAGAHFLLERIAAFAT
jgi:hypothetical protein